MEVTRKAKARFLQSMSATNMTNQDEKSQNDMRCDDHSPSENAENEHESHEIEEIDNDDEAASNDKSSHENKEIEHDVFFDECV